MNEPADPVPTGLPQGTMRALATLVAESTGASANDLLQSARNHLAEIRTTSAENPFINVRLAEAICDRLHLVVIHWDRVPPNARPWLKGAIAYFEANDDEISDDASPIGFEDDCEVMNACLILAGRADLILDPEDFDEF